MGHAVEGAYPDREFYGYGVGMGNGMGNGMEDQPIEGAVNPRAMLVRKPTYSGVEFPPGAYFPDGNGNLDMNVNTTNPDYYQQQQQYQDPNQYEHQLAYDDYNPGPVPMQAHTAQIVQPGSEVQQPAPAMTTKSLTQAQRPAYGSDEALQQIHHTQPSHPSHPFADPVHNGQAQARFVGAYDFDAGGGERTESVYSTNYAGKGAGGGGGAGWVGMAQ